MATKTIDATKKVMTPNGVVLEIGVGATRSCGSDSSAMTVVGFNASGKTISVVEDNSTPDKANGYDYYGNQVYIYTPGDPTYAMIARWSNKYRCYRTKGGDRVHVGHRRTYQNPSF